MSERDADILTERLRAHLARIAARPAPPGLETRVMDSVITPRVRRRPRRMIRLAVAATTASALAGVVAVSLAAHRGVFPGASPNGGGGGAGSASCGVHYSNTSLHQMDYAFDGVLTGISAHPQSGGPEGDQVTSWTLTFHVNHWYKGAQSPTVSLESSIGPDTIGDVEFPRLETGERYLVSGGGGSVGSCGFSRRWSAADAETWAAVFSRPTPSPQASASARPGNGP